MLWILWITVLIFITSKPDIKALLEKFSQAASGFI